MLWRKKGRVGNGGRGKKEDRAVMGGGGRGGGGGVGGGGYYQLAHELGLGSLCGSPGLPTGRW